MTALQVLQVHADWVTSLKYLQHADWVTSLKYLTDWVTSLKYLTDWVTSLKYLYGLGDVLKIPSMWTG